MDFDTKTTSLIFVAIMVVGTLAMQVTPMASRTVYMMVLPSMVVFGLLMVGLGVLHGQHRARQG